MKTSRLIVSIAAAIALSVGTASAVIVDGVFTASDNYQHVQQIGFQLNDGTMVGTGILAWSVDQAGNVFAAFVQPLSINDNTYGTNTVGWGSKKHTFGNLTGSDKGEFDFINTAGQRFIYTLDYLTSSKSSSSQYGSLGVSGGDGSVAKSSVKNVTGGGKASDVLAWGTSLDYNLNTIAGHGNSNAKGLGLGSFTTNSPATTPVHLNPDGTVDYSQGYNNPASAPGWVYNISYEIEIAASAFGANGFASVWAPFAHDSPSKFGQNEILTVVPEPATTSLLVAGIGTLALALYKRDRRPS